MTLSVTFSIHSHNQTLLQSAVLAIVALFDSHRATLLIIALKIALVQHAVVEEDIAGIAGRDAVAQAFRPITAHEADAAWADCVARKRKYSISW